MKKNKLITVVTVCFNAEQKLEKTILSVVNQSLEDKEYIVIDGASTDGSLHIINRYREQMDVFVSEPDNGIYNAMNKAVDFATGEWIIFLNAGDVFADTETLTNAGNFFDDKSDVVYGNIFTEKQGQLSLKEAPDRIENIHRMPFCHQAVFTRTSLLRKNRFDEKYSLSADYKFFKKLMLDKAVFKKMDIAITVYDRSGLSNTQRTRGLGENIAIIRELDDVKSQLKFLPRLYFVFLWNKLRKK